MSIAKVPPHDATAEIALIGSWFLLCDEPSEIRKSRVEPEDFYDPKRALVARAVLSCLDDGIPVEPATVTHRIGQIAGDATRTREAVAVLTQCAADTTSPAHATHFAGLVENAASLRRIQGALAQAQAAIEAPGADASEVREALSDAIGTATSSSQPLAGHVASLLPAAMTSIRSVRDDQGRDGRLSWGVRELDLAGVFIRPGSFPVVAARPGSGKTTFLRRWAFRTAALTQRKVIYLTLEQEPVELAYDELLAEGGVTDPLGKGVTEPDDDMRLLSASEYLQNVPLYAPENFPHRLPALVTWLHRTIAKERPAAIVVDYLTLIQAPGTSAYERATLTSSRLRSVAKQTGCPIVCAAQLNRASAGDRREPELHDLRDSGQIEQDATSVMMLHYPYALAKKEDIRGVDPSELTLFVRKNRHGQSFVKVSMRFEGAMKRMMATEAKRASYY